MHFRAPAVVDDWHDGMVESMVRHRSLVRNAVRTGSSPGMRFDLMTEREVDDYFLAQRANLDHLTVLDLVSAGEAAVRLDYQWRVKGKLKDALSKDYRKFHANLINHQKERPPFGRQGILDILKSHVDNKLARPVGDYRQCLNARHWVAHGRYWKEPQVLSTLTVFETRRRIDALLAALPT